ncbi:hypothetical protein ROZALSC1DRAFT_31903, partial [Rozella allomycis CSF55]
MEGDEKRVEGAKEVEEKDIEVVKEVNDVDAVKESDVEDLKVNETVEENRTKVEETEIDGTRIDGTREFTQTTKEIKDEIVDIESEIISFDEKPILSKSPSEKATATESNAIQTMDSIDSPTETIEGCNTLNLHSEGSLLSDLNQNQAPMTIFNPPMTIFTNPIMINSPISSIPILDSPVPDSEFDQHPEIIEIELEYQKNLQSIFNSYQLKRQSKIKQLVQAKKDSQLKSNQSDVEKRIIELQSRALSGFESEIKKRNSEISDELNIDSLKNIPLNSSLKSSANNLSINAPVPLH